MIDLQSLLPFDLFLQVKGITPGRTVSIVAGVVGLISIGIGWWAMARSTRHTSLGRRMGIAALVIGFTGMVLGLEHFASTTGGFGTGSGRAGAIVAMVIGLTGMFLGWRALVRSQRIARESK